MNVFISHSWSYSDHYGRLAEWIFVEPWYQNGLRVSFFDTSVPRDSPIHYAPNNAALAAAISRRIAGSHIVVIPTGMYAHHSNWIRKEIDAAGALGRRILAVDPWGQQRAASVVARAADELVGWNKNSVVQAVWRLGSLPRKRIWI